MSWKTDRLRHQTAAHLRMLLQTSSGRTAVIVALDEGTSASARLLTSALLWWDQLACARTAARRMVLVTPTIWGEGLERLLSYLELPVSTLRYDGTGGIFEGRSGHGKGEASGWPFVFHPLRPIEPELLGAIHLTLPELDLVFRKSRWELSFRGVRLAWVEPDGSAWFDAQRPRPLVLRARSELESCLRDARLAATSQVPNPYFSQVRPGDEQWLESLVLKSRGRLFDFPCEPIYSQVPTYIGGERRVVDLITVNQDRRLVVVELKTHRDLSLFFQGLEYWERVGLHLNAGDFESKGFFPGIRLNRQPPILCFVTPLFEIHRTVTTLRKYVDRGIPLSWVGINHDWKRGIKLLRRFDF